MIALTDNMTAAYIGSDEVTKVYLGSDLVWEKQASVLPYDAEVKYLESTGTQYIDLGIYFDSTKVYRLYVGYFANTSTGYRVFGARSQAGTYPKSSYLTYVNTDKINFYGSNTMTSSSGTFNSPSISTTGMHTIEICCYPTKRFIVDGSSYNTPSMENAIFQSEYTLALFTENTAGTYAPKSCRFGRLEIYDSTTGVCEHDYIPVRVGQTGYLYDKITGTLKGNSGTGDFVLGNDIDVKPYDAELEWLTSDGNQYFTLPVAPSEGTDAIEMDIRRSANTNQQRLCHASGEATFQVYVNGLGRLAYSRNGSWTVMEAHDRTQMGTVRHLVKVDYYAKRCTLDFYTKTISSTTKQATGNLIITGKYGSNAVFKGAIYSVKFWRSGTLMYDLIPVRKNGVGYFYDKVNDVLYANEGTGNWGLGIDKYTNLSDYTQVDYIQNTTTTATAPYIDTRISNNAASHTIDMQMTVKWNSVDSSLNQQFGTTYLVMWGCNGGVWTNAYAMDDTLLDGQTPSTSEYVTVKSKQFSGTPSYVGPIALFRLYQAGKRGNGDTTYICRCSLSSYKIWEGGILVRDYIPVLHPDNVYGMWDKVEGKFYPSASSGSFTGGNLT